MRLIYFADNILNHIAKVTDKNMGADRIEQQSKRIEKQAEQKKR